MKAGRPCVPIDFCQPPARLEAIVEDLLSLSRLEFDAEHGRIETRRAWVSHDLDWLRGAKTSCAEPVLLPELGESFNVNLSNLSSNASPGNMGATVTIIDDEEAPPVADVQKAEGNSGTTPPTLSSAGTQLAGSASTASVACGITVSAYSRASLCEAWAIRYSSLMRNARLCPAAWRPR
jgi:hypothetical protein